MTVPFSNIPANTRVPLFYAELDNAMAGYFAQNMRTLLVGQKTAMGFGASNVQMLVSKTDEAKLLFGEGSMLARMHEKYRQGDSTGDVWCIALDDPAAGVAAAGAFVITGPATKAGTLNAYIGNDRVQVGVAATDTATAVGTVLAAAINANNSLPVTAIATAGSVALTAKQKGVLHNDVLLQMNMQGSAGGESTPAGLQVAITPMSGGTASPSLTAAMAALGDEEFDFIIHPFTDTTSLDAFRMLMNDQTGRWAFNRQIFGHVYTAKRALFSELQAAGVSRNDQHSTTAGFETLVPNPVWEYSAAYGARNAVFIKADPSRPTQTGVLTGITPAPSNNRFIWSERQTLLFSGIATSYVAGGEVRIERAVTNYQKNSWGQADPSYLDSETMHQLAAILRRMRNVITQKYPRSSLANDGTPIAPGGGIVTPSVIRGELLSEYSKMEKDGLVENLEAFSEHLIVERNANDPNRLDILYPPDLVNQLRVFAVLAQFRLQY